MTGKTELLEKLNTFFDEIYFNKQESSSYSEFMSKRNMNEGRFNSYACNMVPLSTMTEEELFWFISYPKLELKVEDYYSPDEIKKYSKSKSKQVSTVYPIIFKNVLQVSQDQFVTTINTGFLYELYNSNVLVYNVHTQRSPRITKRNGEETIKININKRSVNEIKGLIERNLFIPNDLSFNIRSDGSASFIYDKYNGELEIKNGSLDILDGFHRIMAIIKVMNEEPEYDKTFVLNIMNFDEGKAKRFVAQQDKRNKINASYSKSLDDTRYESLIVNRLNESKDSALFGQIKSIGERKFDYGRMATMIRAIFNPSSMEDVYAVSNLIIKSLDKIITDNKVKVLSGEDEIKILFAYLSITNDLDMDKYYEVRNALADDKQTLKYVLKLKRFVADALTEIG